MSDSVFPAYAGMFRILPCRPWTLISFPRIRGDVPLSKKLSTSSYRFSPHTRGCSLWHYGDLLLKHVFPAYAGMFLTKSRTAATCLRFPRIRGDVPLTGEKFVEMGMFSPHTRGCSGGHGRVAEVSHVFPAYAGMFL